MVIWFLAGSTRINADLRASLVGRNNTVFVSVVTGWELAIKLGLGKLQLPPDLRLWLPGELEASGFELLPITLTHALAVETLPLHHRDPFDRLLIAQARAEDLMLVTADPWFNQYDVRLHQV